MRLIEASPSLMHLSARLHTALHVAGIPYITKALTPRFTLAVDIGSFQKVPGPLPSGGCLVSSIILFASKGHTEAIEYIPITEVSL